MSIDKTPPFEKDLLPFDAFFSFFLRVSLSILTKLESEFW